MKHTFKLSLIATAVALAGCGGGANGGNSKQISNPNPNFAVPVNINAYTPLSGSAIRNPITDIYVKDLNNDQSDEVVVGGRVSLSQPIPANEWQNFNMQIYGWNTGQFSNETSTWFRPGENSIKGTSGVKFGDFNGDGNIDMFTQPDTDTTTERGGLYAEPWVFYNTGNNSFTRELVHNFDQWAHDSHVGDYDGDGYDDIMIPAYGTAFTVNYGGPNGFTTYTTNGIDVAGQPGYGSGASISVGNYLDDGTTTIVMTDSGRDAQHDVKLLRIYTKEQSRVQIQEVAVLPSSRFYLPKWSTQLADSPTTPHAIRNFAFDFNNDGLDDVIIIDSLGSSNNYYHEYSEIQFLENKGNGSFSDVTDDVLVNYDHSKIVSYNPMFVDFNNDGLTDIFLSYQSFDSDNKHRASRILMQTSDGKFVEKYADVFSDFYNQIQDLAGANLGWQQPISIIKGPSGDSFLFGGVPIMKNGKLLVKSYLSKIGTAGTITPMDAFNTIKANWPYLTDTEVASVMTNTGTTLAEGQTVVNLDLAMTPVGNIKINSGWLPGTTIRIPGLDSQKFERITGYDSIGRNFNIDLSKVTSSAESNFSSVSADPMQSYSTGLLLVNGSNAYGNNQAYGFGANSSLFNKDNPWVYGLTVSKTQNHPWMDFTGVFGTVNGADNVELDISRKLNNGMWGKAGLIQTKTSFTPGLVTQVDDIWSTYFVTGYSNKNLTMYGGIEPKIVSGSVAFNLPESVDKSGNAVYNLYESKVRNNTTGFIGMNYTQQAGFADLKMESKINTTGNYNIGVEVSMPW